MASKQLGRKYPRETPTNAEIRALLDQTSGRSATQRRNHALFSFMWGTGARVNEALEVRPADLNFETKKCYLRVTKGNHPRHVAVGPEALDSARRWLEARSRLDLPADAPLFCTLKGKKMHDQYVREAMKRYAERAGWTTRAHPHALRHAHAALLAKTLPAQKVQKQLGHASLKTTTVYLDAITVDDVVEAMEQVDWS